MIVWLDAHLSPATAVWLSRTYNIEAVSVRDLGFRDASDRNIFAAARDARAVVITKDSDFVTLQGRHGAPPQIVFLRCGNTSKARLKVIFSETWEHAMRLLREGEPLVEITD